VVLVEQPVQLEHVPPLANPVPFPFGAVAPTLLQVVHTFEVQEEQEVHVAPTTWEQEGEFAVPL